MSRIVVLTTPTSGTGSLWRIIRIFLPASIPTVPFIDDCVNRGLSPDDIKKEVLPEHGCFLFNQPHLFNFDQDFSDTKFILNFRDPRDMSCNQYYWVFVHPSPKSPEELETFREETRKAGIDRYALNLDHKPLLANHEKFSQRPDLLLNTLVCSYVQLCFDTDGLIDRVSEFLGNTDQPLIRRTKASEHPSSVSGAKWQAQKWEGADVFPGRARVELKPETYVTLTKRYAGLLSALKQLDLPQFGYFYGE